MTIKKSVYLVLFILLLLTPSLATAALSPEATEIPYQINNSDRIVIGTVSEINVYSGYTITTISVKEWLYNPLPAKIIKVMITNGVEDEAEFTQNESVLVMLNDKRSDLQLFSVAIGSPGKHPVSDRDAVIKELKAQGKWQGENQTGNKSLNEPVHVSSSSSIALYTHEDLSNNSETIVIGTVKEILPSKWNSIDGKKPNANVEFSPYNLIYTDIIISVDKYLKNPLSSQEVIARVDGGTVGNDTLTAEDEPSFKAGEKVLLYLNKDTSPGTMGIGPEHFKVTGFMQGKFILTDSGKAIGSDNEIISQEELLSTINQTDNKTNNTGMTANTGTVGKQAGNSNSTQKSKSTPFISPVWVLAVVLGAVTYVRKTK